MATKRIYIGGLTSDISQSDVAGRFTPFGEVVSVEVIRAKAVGADPDSCRGFAYVTLHPKDDASMARMLSLYNGCKWRGQKLRVEVAKPDYLTRLQHEWQEDQEKEQQQQQLEQQQREAEQPQQHLPQQQDAHKDGEVGSEEAHILRLTVPNTNHKTITVDLTAKSKSHRSWFPTHNSKRPHELDWEPLPPCKRSALQAAAEASVVRLDAAAAAQQLRATQELLADIAEQQRRQQQLLVVPQGVEVPFSYQEQQHQQQQQQSLEQPAGKKGKGSSKVVEQELLSQLKLLKRISEREQHGQQRQASRGSKAVVEFPDADDAKQQQQQQQQVRNVPGRAGSMHAGAAAAAGAGESLPTLPNSVYDSDSDSESESDVRLRTAGAAMRGQQGELLVAAATGAPANVTMSQVPAFAPAAQQEQQQQQQQQLTKLGKGGRPEQQLGAAGVDEPGLSDLSDVSSDYESDQWEQWLAAEGLAAAADATDLQPVAGAAAENDSDMQGPLSSGDVSSPRSDAGGSSPGDALDNAAAAADRSGLQQQRLKGPAAADRVAALQEPPQRQQQQREQQHRQQIAGKQQQGKQQQGKQQQGKQQQGKQQQVGKAASQATDPAAPAGLKQSQPAAKQVVHAVPIKAPAAAAHKVPAAAVQHLRLSAASAAAAALSQPAGLWDLDRFGSDSEEVLIDADSDGVDMAVPAAAAAVRKSATKRKLQSSRQVHSGDMLLCPKVKKA